MKREKLSAARYNRGWSQVQLAEKLKVSRETISLWERGLADPQPHYVEKLCTLFNKESEELDLQRRALLRVATGLGMVALTGSSFMDDQFIVTPSQATLNSLDSITRQFRQMQRRGDIFAEGLHAHITTIQDTLTRTSNEAMRQDLWKLLASTQLLARLGPVKKRELAAKRTYNELAISYAQQSGNNKIKAAMIGHLAQFYLRFNKDYGKASQYLSEAKQTTKDAALQTWFALLDASVSAGTGQTQTCEASLAYAIDRAHAENDDTYFTDLSMTSAQIFGANCWLTLGNAQKAHSYLASIHLPGLADNRQASACYDFARCYTALGDLDVAKNYALQAIDKATETHQLYVISRCITLATTILEQDPHEPHALTIAEYARAKGEREC